MNPFLELLKINKLPGSIKILIPRRVIPNTLSYCHTWTQLDPSWAKSQQGQATRLLCHTTWNLSIYLENAKPSQKESLSPPYSIIPGKRRLKYVLYLIQSLSFIKVVEVPITSRSNQNPSQALLPLPQRSQELMRSLSDFVTLTCFYNWTKNSFMMFQAPWRHTNVASQQ